MVGIDDLIHDTQEYELTTNEEFEFKATQRASEANSPQGADAALALRLWFAPVYEVINLQLLQRLLINVWLKIDIKL